MDNRFEDNSPAPEGSARAARQAIAAAAAAVPAPTTPLQTVVQLMDRLDKEVYDYTMPPSMGVPTITRTQVRATLVELRQAILHDRQGQLDSLRAVVAKTLPAAPAPAPTEKLNIPGFHLPKSASPYLPSKRLVDLMQKMEMPLPYAYQSEDEAHWHPGVEAYYQSVKPQFLEKVRDALGYGASPLLPNEDSLARQFLVIWMSINHKDSWLMKEPIDY